jgi:hypothetical protein
MSIHIPFSSFLRRSTLLSRVIPSLIGACFALATLPLLLTNIAQADPSDASSTSSLEIKEVKELWGELHQDLESLGKLHGQHSRLPKSKWFGNSQKKNTKKINKMTRGIIEELNLSPINEVLEEREKILKKIKAKEKKVIKLKEKRSFAPKEDKILVTSQAEYDEKIKKVTGQIKVLKESLASTISKIHVIFKRMGLEIKRRQVEDLFGVVSGETMRDFLVRFSNLKLLSELIANLIKESPNSGEYANQARKYYGVYVALEWMMIEAHRVAAERIGSVHIPKIEALLNKTNKQVENTMLLISQTESEQSKEILNANLKTQQKLESASKNYRTYLETQQMQINDTVKRLEEKFKTTLNTYQTVDLAQSLVMAMKNGVKDIQDLQKLKLPKMIPISSDELQNDFNTVSQQLGASAGDSLNR